LSCEDKYVVKDHKCEPDVDNCPDGYEADDAKTKC
jgi:hypothetical protein